MAVIPAFGRLRRLDQTYVPPLASTGRHSRSDQRTSVCPLSRWDTVWMAAGLLLTATVSYALGYHRIFWEDEMLGWMLLRDPSWHHMVAAWRAGADGGGFSFYITGRVWFWIFGASEVSFRLYSAAGFGLSLCMLWVTLRRFYNLRIVAFALFNTWFFSSTIVTHMAEGRFYGLLMLSVTVALWLVVKADETDRMTPLLYLGMFVAHGVLTTSHLLGIVYSATLLGALMVLDRVRGRRIRTMLYVSAACSWFLLLPERAAILASAQVGKPHFWTTPPNLSRLIGAYSAYSAEIATVLCVLSVLAVVALLRSDDGWQATLRQAFVSRRAAYLVTLALLLVPLEFVIEGWFGPSLFINRYLMPVAIAQAFLTAEAIELIDWKRLSPPLGQSKAVRWCAALGFGAVLLVWDLEHLSRMTMLHPDYTEALTARLPSGVPVLCEDAWAFAELIGRQHASGVRYTYLLDWKQSASDAAPRLEATQYHLMENWRKAGYFAGSIEYRDPFLRDNRRFLVLHVNAPRKTSEPPMIGDPLYQRFAADPAYQVIPYVGRDGKPVNDVWMVCSRSCSSTDL